jgi:GR25 family glycosyltransferase involved in LPS biosynthesis
MKKLVINLKRRTDRLEQINLPFDYEIFEATDGKEKFSEFGKMQGHIGCWDSHRRLFTEVKDKNIDMVMVLEDDIEVCEDFNKKLEKVMTELPEDWDLLYLGGWNIGDVEKYSESLNLAKNVLTTHAFIVRSKFYDTILEGINSRKWKIDILISETLSKGNCFICNPTIAWQKEGFSDIENRVTNNIHLK